MFNQIKKQVSIIDAYNHYFPVPLKGRGENDFIPEDNLCPWHGGDGSFHIVFNEDEPDRGFAKCFSSACVEESPADVIEFVRRSLELDSPKDAAERIISDFKLNIQLESSMAQRIFNEATEYYKSLMLSNKQIASLGGRTPLDYQKEVRGHSENTLVNWVGWTDGKLWEHLTEIKGFTADQIVESGLCSKGNNSLRDKLPKDSFIYVAYVGKKPSRFTFKCLQRRPDGTALLWQMKKDSWLNKVSFLGQETLESSQDPFNVAVVEGENDFLSLIDLGWQGSIVCTNGQPSKEQYELLAELGQDRNVHTFFDSDEAGNRYRQILWTKSIPHLSQYRVPEEDGDIDKYLQRRRSDSINPIERILEEGEVTPPSQEEINNTKVKVTGSGAIIEKNNCYFGIREIRTPSGETIYNETQLSNFTLQLKCIFMHRGDRSREVILTRQDGVISESCFLNSTARSSLRQFKEFCSKSIDAIWLGTESDLNNLWLHISLTQREREVNVPEYCGYVKELNMWLFRNVMINNATGATYIPDDRGIFWITPTSGIMPQSIVSDILSDGINRQDAYHIPALKMDLTSEEEFFEWQGDVLHKLAEIVGPHEACTMLAWAQSNAYSSFIFDQEGFSLLFLLWGRHGKGKTTFLRWLLATYNMDVSNKGYMQVSGIERSTVGFLRKAEYYSSLPLAMDEIRADEKTRGFYSMWRGFFDRSPRVLGTARQGVVRQQPIRSNLAFAGQDAFMDAAMQSRCISFKTTSVRSDINSQNAYRWLDEETDCFPRLGFHWIREAATINKVQLKEDWREMGELIQDEFRGIVIGNRTREMWKIIGSFANRFMESYFPGESYLPWMMTQIVSDTEMQTEVDIVSEVWDKIAAGQVSSHPTITLDHVLSDNHFVYIWWPGIKDELTRVLQHLGHAPSTLRSALREESYFAGECIKGMGLASHQRRVMKFDITNPNCPEALRQIASVSPHQF